MDNLVINTLKNLREFAIDQKIVASFFYHEEDSYLMRFANSAISLNTNEHLIRLDITVHDGNKRASYQMITDLSKFEDMKAGILTAAEMVKHAQPLNYQTTIPVYNEDFIDETCFDQTLAEISNEEKLSYFNAAVEGLESEVIKSSGVFSNGYTTIGLINTQSEYPQIYKVSDAQVTIVLSHDTHKWEIISEQSAQKKSDLDPQKIHQDLDFLLKHYLHDAPVQIPLGTYDIVFGPAASADLINFMNWIGFNGGTMKRGYSFIAENQINKKLFSSKFTLVDNPTLSQTFPFKKDFMGISREPFTLVDEGVFKGFTWYQDDADEFNAKPTGHTVMHKSLCVSSGNKKINNLEELVNTPRERDILYIPFLHYMNIVNPSAGLVTGSSRFGALLLRKDGSVEVPYNVRLTQSLLDIFGDKLEWLTEAQTVYNTSLSYGARNPSAIIVPTFMKVRDLEISHSNSSY